MAVKKFLRATLSVGRWDVTQRGVIFGSIPSDSDITAAWLCHPDARQICDLPGYGSSFMGLRPATVIDRFK